MPFNFITDKKSRRVKVYTHDIHFIHYTLMLRLNPDRLDTQGVMADLALYLGSKLKLEQEEGLKVF